MTATPFLMFQGDCEEALTFYAATLPDSRIERIERYSGDGPGAPGSVRAASATLAGLPVRANDSPVAHAFGFTPAISLWIDCADTAEIERLATALGENGKTLMPLDAYGFSTRFAWIEDRFGVSWQLNLT